MRRLNVKVTFLVAGLLVLASAVATAQEHPTLSAQPNSVFVGADGKLEAPPDTAVLQFNISAQADTSRAAYDQASKEAEQTRQVLRSNGIEPSAAEIGFYTTQPMYDWKEPKHRLIGYRVTTSVSLKLKDFSKIGPITQQLAEANVGESQSLNYMLKDMDAAKTKAVEDAYRHARASADTIARASGRTLGELSYASVDTFENIRPIPMRAPLTMMRAQAEAAPPTQEFTPQNITVTAHVNAMFTLK
jgi:uncharacterized protein